MRLLICQRALRVFAIAVVIAWYTRPIGAQVTDSARVAAAAVADTMTTWGSVDAGNGFTVANTDRGTLVISAYALWRYINQLPVNPSYVDHLGVAHEIDTRNDLQLHRVQVFFKGWMYLPKFRYAITIWTVNATQQVAVVGTLTYEFSKQFRLSGGVNGLPGTRSLGGSHPYWLGTDRVMADEYFRPGFTSGMWETGEAFPQLFYTAMVGDNLSQLGITAGQLTRNLATGATIWWVPTTGEFGPRGAYGDYEGHQQLATQFGTSYVHSHENRFNQLGEQSPDNTQIRLSDGLLLFQTGALADGATVTDATYQLNAFDAGFKYRGAFLQTEYYFRRLDRFATDLPVPIHAIVDRGWMLQASYMAVPKRFEFYAGTS
ncbi:MAG TPA: hypothetical protein VGM82_18475 [Gemmatimonadaceae bacterium]